MRIARGVKEPGGPLLVTARGRPRGDRHRGRALGIRASVGCRSWSGGGCGEYRGLPQSEAGRRRGPSREFTELVATAVENAQGREELRRVAEEQAALRRVATLVARGEPPDAVFASVAEEVGRLLPADRALVARYDTDDSVTPVAGWSRTGDTGPVGQRYPFTPDSVSRLVRESGRPARIDDYDAGGAASTLGIRSAVGAPITVQGRLWGLVVAASSGPEPPQPATEARLAGFTELVATAIANASPAELADWQAGSWPPRPTPRRVERASMTAPSNAWFPRPAAERRRRAIPPPMAEVHQELADVGRSWTRSKTTVELSRGIHPAVL